VQSTALNGAQIASLMEVCQLVVSRELPPAAAKELIKISFPTITESQVDKLIASLATAEAPATAVVV
jgi:DNA-binding transcriptional regulator LsrR (DeoR family)